MIIGLENQFLVFFESGRFAQVILYNKYHTVNVLKFGTLLACQKAKAKSADPDQTASEEAV